MVHFMSSENSNVWQLAEPEPKFFAGDEYLINFSQTDEDGPLVKRWKPSPSFQTAPQPQQVTVNNNVHPTPQPEYHPLNEPSPLGLRLKKSPSLLELAEQKLNQGNTDKDDLSDENLDSETKRDSRARPRARASSSADKLKASHFPALLLRIGQWEYVSRHEGDLVAKCYFSKHKIVWEFLDGGLKKKSEINWADIIALKANCAADGFGTLTLVLDKPPHFFNEINPQPRKHTQWRATSDFTDGEASTHRQHFLQCAQGVLDKHYEKLINCDSRLNFLSQQEDIVLDFPYFTENTCISNQDMSGNSSFDLSEIYNSALLTTSPSTLQTCSSQPVESSSLGFIHQDMSNEALSPNPVIDFDFEVTKGMLELFEMPFLPPTISMPDQVNHNVNGGSEQQTLENLPYSDLQPNPNDALENISHLLLSDSSLPPASDEAYLMSRINSLGSLLEPDRNAGSTQLPQQDTNDNYNPESNPKPENETTPQANNAPESNEESGMTRKDSYSDLLQQLPRIASLPKFMFDMAENGDILM